ncbi:unnamed protein product, partial [Laminaria digitata]
ELVEIYGDTAGEPHLRRIEIDFEMRDFAPPSQPLGVSAEMPSSASLFLTAPPGWDKSFHPTPRKQLAVLLSGDIRISVSDGESIELEPGDTFLLNDMASKGHLTQVQGEQDASFLFVVLTENGS